MGIWIIIWILAWIISLAFFAFQIAFMVRVWQHCNRTEEWQGKLLLTARKQVTASFQVVEKLEDSADREEMPD